MSKRYYLRYAERLGPTQPERYVVVDIRSNESVAGPFTYEEAKREMRARQATADAQELEDYAIARMFTG